MFGRLSECTRDVIAVPGVPTALVTPVSIARQVPDLYPGGQLISVVWLSFRLGVGPSARGSVI
jgi:hypothetical protein